MSRAYADILLELSTRAYFQVQTNSMVWSFMLILIGQGRGSIDPAMNRSYHIPGLDTSSYFMVFQLFGRQGCNL